MTHVYLVDNAARRLDTGSLQQLLHSQRAEFGSAETGQSTTVLAHRGPGIGADDRLRHDTLERRTSLQWSD